MGSKNKEVTAKEASTTEKHDELAGIAREYQPTEEEAQEFAVKIVNEFVSGTACRSRVGLTEIIERLGKKKKPPRETLTSLTQDMKKEASHKFGKLMRSLSSSYLMWGKCGENDLPTPSAPL